MVEKDFILSCYGFDYLLPAQKISMTVPVSTRVVETDEKSRMCQMGFYVPKEFQNDTPAPSDPRVKIVQRDLHVYSM
jgi:hypothetical protein